MAQIHFAHYLFNVFPFNPKPIPIISVPETSDRLATRRNNIDDVIRTQVATKTIVVGFRTVCFGDERYPRFSEMVFLK